MAECEEELGKTRDAIKLLDTIGLRVVMPKLETVAVSSIYGRDDNLTWWRYEDWVAEQDPDSTQSPMKIFGENFHDALCSSPTLRHLCIRDPSGPYHIPNVSFASETRAITPTFTQAIHVDFSRENDQVSMPLGSPIQWISDSPANTDLGLIFRRMHENVKDLCGIRDTYLTHRRWPDTADITIYGSTSQITPRIVYHHVGDVDLGPCVAEYGPEALRRQDLTDYEERVTVKSMAEVLQKELRKRSRVKDVVRWLPARETPRCSACGSLPPGC